MSAKNLFHVGQAVLYKGEKSAAVLEVHTEPDAGELSYYTIEFSDGTGERQVRCVAVAGFDLLT